MSADRERASSRRSAASTSTGSRIPMRPRITSSSPAGASPTRWSRRSPSTRTSRTGCASSATRRSTTSSREADADVGRQRSPRSTSRTSTTTSSRPRNRSTSGRISPPRFSTRGTSSASRRREEVPRRGRCSVRVEVVYHKRCRIGPRAQRVSSSSTWTRRCASTRTSSSSTWPRSSRLERQQVRGAQLGRVVGRVVHLRATGREDRDSRCRPISASTPRTWASSSGR